MYFSKLFIYFIIYSILGYVFETIFCTITQKKWQNRGMLIGPWCPIYGVGIIANILINKNNDNYLQVFLICMIGSAILEYVTHFLTEKLFNAVWWDYSDMPLNIKGRICLPASLFFGIGGIFSKFWLHPLISYYIDKIPNSIIEILGMMLIAIFSADIALTSDSLVSLNQKINKTTDNINNILTEKYDILVVGAGNIKLNAIKKIDETKEKISLPNIEAIKEQSEKLKENINWKQKRLLISMKKIRGKSNKKSYVEILKNLKFWHMPKK